MRIAITGAQGQLGVALQHLLTAHELLLMDLPTHDIAARAIIPTVVDFAPEVVINCAAYTNVDNCELNPEDAYRVNAIGVQNLALACQKCDAALVHVSTDYVFAGDQREPYWEFDQPRPISVYGASKLAGEWYAQTLLRKFYIARTAWLYSRTGKNFVKTVLRLAREKGELSMVTNEVGSPTYAPDLAAALVQLMQTGQYGIYHLTNSGHCSRYEFAAEILRQGEYEHVPLHPIDNYPRPARPPAYCVLRNFCAAEWGITLRSWQEGLAAYFGGGD